MTIPANQSRRGLLKAAALTGFAGLAAAQPLAADAAPRHMSGGQTLNVLDFGAKGDAKTDNTAAFQKALDSANELGGGTVFAPLGQYLFKGHLTIPANTTLAGIFTAPPAFVRDQGTVLLPTEGKGSADGPPFISAAGTNATLRGLAIYYPEQDENAAEPTPYPWTIGKVGHDDFTVLDVALTNPYQAMDLTGAGRHYIARVYGQPISIGIYVDNIFDVGRIENIHFWPFWTMKPAMRQWISANGVALRFARTDWEYVLNTFVLGYKIGYHFVAGAKGACNGNFVGIGSDASGDAVVVEQTQPACGLLITNGEFVGDARSDSQGLIVQPTNTGPVTLQNCGFWGQSDHIATIRGSGPVTLIGCNVDAWDKNKTGAPAFVLDSTGGATIANCQFLRTGTKVAVEVTDTCTSAVVMGNTAVGGEFNANLPANPDPKRIQVGMNVGTGAAKPRA